MLSFCVFAQEWLYFPIKQNQEVVTGLISNKKLIINTMARILNKNRYKVFPLEPLKPLEPLELCQGKISN